MLVSDDHDLIAPVFEGIQYVAEIPAYFCRRERSHVITFPSD
jgi:hypothetical protein